MEKNDFNGFKTAEAYNKCLTYIRDVLSVFKAECDVEINKKDYGILTVKINYTDDIEFLFDKTGLFNINFDDDKGFLNPIECKALKALVLNEGNIWLNSIE